MNGSLSIPITQFRSKLPIRTVCVTELRYGHKINPESSVPDPGTAAKQYQDRCGRISERANASWIAATLARAWGQYVQNHGWIEEPHDARPRSGERSYGIFSSQKLHASCEEVIAKESIPRATLQRLRKTGTPENRTANRSSPPIQLPLPNQSSR